jgi:hypothetical protein
MKKIDLTLKREILIAVVSTFLIILFGCWLAALLLPDWSYYLENEIFYSLVGWTLAMCIGILAFMMLYFIIDLAIERQVSKNKIIELEERLEEIKKY